LIELQLRETIVIFVRGSGCVLKLPKREWVCECFVSSFEQHHGHVQYAGCGVI
jgi:hypothetical protein